MDKNEEIALFEFDCPDEPLPEGATAAPRPPYRPRPIPAEAAAAWTSANPVINAELQQFVGRLIGSPAIQKFQEGRKDEITFADACRFWDITESMRGQQFDEALAFVAKSLTELNRSIATIGVLSTSSRQLTADDMRALWSVFFHLEKRFARHLALLRGRGSD